MLRNILMMGILGCLWIGCSGMLLAGQDRQLEESAVLRGKIEQVDLLSRTLQIDHKNYRVSDTTRIRWRRPNRASTFWQLKTGMRIRYLLSATETDRPGPVPSLAEITITSKP